jgi:hypothetical protein
VLYSISLYWTKISIAPRMICDSNVSYASIHWRPFKTSSFKFNILFHFKHIIQLYPTFWHKGKGIYNRLLRSCVRESKTMEQGCVPDSNIIVVTINRKIKTFNTRVHLSMLALHHSIHYIMIITSHLFYFIFCFKLKINCPLKIQYHRRAFCCWIYLLLALSLFAH